MNSVRWTLSALAAAALVACGGGGGGAPSSSSLSGSVVKGPVGGSTVCAYVLVSTGKGSQLGCTTTDADGAYSLSLNYSGPVVVEATGGTYTDEATGAAGSSLAVPLLAAGTAGPGAPALIATPLTTIAYTHASAGGGLSVGSFDAAALDVGAAFGLPASVHPARTLPVVTGTPNAYGEALIGVSRMLGKGATLAGIVANADLPALKAGYQLAGGNSCLSQPAQDRPAILAEPDGVYFVPGDEGQALLSLKVSDPEPVWRGLLPMTGDVMGCQVVSNTAGWVELSCAPAAFSYSTTLIGPGGDMAAPTSLPSMGGIVAAGRHIEIKGTVPAGESLNIYASDVVFLPGTTAGGGVPVTPVPPIQIGNGHGNIVGTIGGIGATTGTISPGGGSVTLHPLCLSGDLSADGAPLHAGTVATSGGNVVTPAGTVSSQGGGVVVSGNGGGIVVSGSGTGSGGVTIAPGANP